MGVGEWRREDDTFELDTIGKGLNWIEQRVDRKGKERGNVFQYIHTCMHAVCLH